MADHHGSDGCVSGENTREIGGCQVGRGELSTVV
jgi:hypothetical protein